MNCHEVIATLLEVLKPYTENSNIQISDDLNLVIIDSLNNIGFEVFDNEIIIYYFTDHYHFEDYSSEPEKGEKDYIERAKIFLKDLLEEQIRKIEYYKGKTLVQEKYFIIYTDGREDACIGNTIHSLLGLFNLFLKKVGKSKSWQFDKTKGVFTNFQPKKTDPNAIEVIDVNEDCFIEIFEEKNGYTYKVTEADYDSYYGMYFWIPAADILPSGIYDTKEKAIFYAKEATKNK